MASLLKYEMKCLEEDCEKKAIIVVPVKETEVPNICAFCGGETVEDSGSE